MRTVFVVSLTLAAFALAGCRGPEVKSMTGQSLTPGQHKRLFEKTISKTLTMRYLLYLPADYYKGREKWPLILFLHGAGERGDDLELVEKHGPPKIVKQKDMPFIIVSPQCPRDSWWPKHNEVLIALLDDIVSRFRVDEDRIYLTGLSMGGYGSWSLACDYPRRFAAVAPICGGGEPFFARKLRNTPVCEKSRVMVEAIKRAGGDARLTVYPEAGHDSWTQTYDNPDLYEWFLGHSRQ